MRVKSGVAILSVLLLAGCGAPTDGRYVGRMTGDGPAPCPDSRAVLLLRGTEARFIPDEGIVVLEGSVLPDGRVEAAAQRAGARSDQTGRNGAAPAAPFRMVFQGRMDDGKVTGEYGTPRCRGRVTLLPG